MDETTFSLVAPSFERKTRIVIVRGRAIKAVISTHPCDVRCTSARGNLCECSCGGKNHGQDFRPGLRADTPVAEVARSLF
jgi:hypothetical protein